MFKAQLSGGLREASEKRITIEDVDAVTFKALLKFLYTDDLSHVEQWLTSVLASADGEDAKRQRIADVVAQMREAVAYTAAARAAVHACLAA